MKNLIPFLLILLSSCTTRLEAQEVLKTETDSCRFKLQRCYNDFSALNDGYEDCIEELGDTTEEYKSLLVVAEDQQNTIIQLETKLKSRKGLYYAVGIGSGVGVLLLLASFLGKA